MNTDWLLGLDDEAEHDLLSLLLGELPESAPEWDSGNTDIDACAIVDSMIRLANRAKPANVHEEGTDKRALTEIAIMLRDPEWGVGMLEDIAQIVQRAGCDIATCKDQDGEPIRTWDRH